VDRIRFSKHWYGDPHNKEFEIMKIIPLTQGKEALVSDVDYEFLNQFSWCANFCHGSWYTEGRVNGKITKIHRLVAVRMGLNPKQFIDHANRNGLDNRRSNLRNATRSQNGANRDLNSNNTSGYKGVSWSKSSSKWQSQIRVDCTTLHLGYFDSKIEAAKTYNRAAVRVFNESAKLNEV